MAIIQSDPHNYGKKTQSKPYKKIGWGRGGQHKVNLNYFAPGNHSKFQKKQTKTKQLWGTPPYFLYYSLLTTSQLIASSTPVLHFLKEVGRSSMLKCVMHGDCSFLCHPVYLDLHTKQHQMAMIRVVQVLTLMLILPSVPSVK